MKVYSATDVGRVRQTNQDYLYVSEQPLGNLPNLFIVADGMGGHRAGDFASSYAVRVFVEAVKEDDSFNPVRIMRRAIENANRQLYEQSLKNENMKGMGTTFVAATIVGRYAYIANVGDSRLYLYDGKMEQVTRDHSLVGEMLRMGEISKEEARVHPDRNIITRALGVGEDVSADFFDVRLEDHVKMVLCSDGLSGYVTDQSMADILENCEEEDNPAELLLAKANENGGGDNIAVIVVSPQKEDDSQKDRNIGDKEVS